MRAAGGSVVDRIEDGSGDLQEAHKSRGGGGGRSGPLRTVADGGTTPDAAHSLDTREPPQDCAHSHAPTHLRVLLQPPRVNGGAAGAAHGDGGKAPLERHAALHERALNVGQRA